MGAAFRRLGAKPQAVALDDRIVPVSQPTASELLLSCTKYPWLTDAAPKRPLRDGFRWVVELLGEAATRYEDSLSFPLRMLSEPNRQPFHSSQRACCSNGAPIIDG